MVRKISSQKGVAMQKMMVSIPPGLYRQLLHFCVDAKKTRSKAVEEALEHYLKEKEGKRAE
jgi:metal-responsive CopG/Arc/MetJ family transcriptional regulator